MYDLENKSFYLSMIEFAKKYSKKELNPIIEENVSDKYKTNCIIS